MQTFLHYRWRVPSTLHRLHLRRIIPLLLLALCVTGAKAQTNVKFNGDIRYSQWVIDSRLGDFYGNKKQFGFTTYDRDLKAQTTLSKWKDEEGKDYNIQVDYVAGLVAKATIEAAEYYKAFTWAKPWFKSVEWYGNKCTVPTSTNNLDAINASKMYFGIYNLANGSFSSNAESTTVSKATTQLGNALAALRNYNKEYKSDGSGGYAFPATTVTRDGQSISLTGGWFHKNSYLNEMWLDGQYMGPATLAQLIKGYSSYTPISSNDWELITKQFSIVWNMCWDETNKLLYHAFCSEARSKTWAANAEIWTTAQTNTESWQGMSAAGHSAAFWGRAEGWYFLALVDVLEQMQKAGLDKESDTNTNYTCYTTLKGYLDKLAAGIMAKQDATGCWYQLIAKDGKYSASYYGGNTYTPTSNYLESSCTAIFTAAYLKAIRLGLLSSETYGETANKAYQGMIEQFMKQRTDRTVDLLGCCKSAGLGTSAVFDNEKFRDGSNAYYLLGNDVPPTSSSNKSDYYTEGKVMGAFIMAATEYERAPENQKAIRFSYDLAPTYTLAKGKSITAEALGSGEISYKWYNASNDSEVSGATEATFNPTESGKYYCKATSGTTTIQTSTAQVTVNAVSNEGSGSGETEPSPATFVYTSGGNAYGSGSSFTVSDITVASGSGTSTSGYLQVGQSEVLTITPADGVTITNITITWTDVSNVLQPSTGNPELSTSGTTSTWTGSSTSALSWTNSSSTTARISSIVVTYSTGASLNASNLAYTKAYRDAGNAWTPAVNGTIDVSKLVSSSSKGAYSITSEGNVATIEGTTIKALTSGKFTLSQAADDTYQEGSKEITVRIGTDVTSDETNEYSFTAETTDVSDGMTITCKDITMTFGNDGFWSQAPAKGYTGGQVNPQVSAYIPTAGTFYKFTPTKPGSLAVKIRLGHLNGNLRPLYVSENGTLIKAKDKNGTELDPEKMPPAKSTYVDNVTFNVKKGKDYYVYVTGSKLGFYGFDFTPATVYTVTYNMNGHGTQIDAVTDDNTLPETLPTPTADGYTFVGWYTNAALTQEATPGASISAPTTLYAKWKPITDLFSLTGVTSTDKTVASKTPYDVTSADATVTGGSVQLYNGHSEPKAMIYSSQINLNGSGGSYMKITLDNTLKAGDEIIINPETSSFKLSATESNSGIDPFTGSYVIKEGDAVVGKNVIYLYRGSNSLITDINITRYYPESDSRATFTYNGAEIAFSEETAGDKSAYTTTLEIGASKKEQTITITPKTKVAGAAITQDKTTVSGDITITVPSTIGNTTTSTYTVTSKDGTSTTTYEINVKLVKENVVLVYAQSDGKTEWIWDKNKDSSQPNFEQPTLKVYLVNADGTKSEKEVTGIKYKSDVTDVATVIETTGTITIQKNANGGAKIYAILKDNPDYNDTHTFFNILVKQGYSYSVAGDAAIANGPDLNHPVYIKKGDTNLVKMTFGGWKWDTYRDENNKLISTYKVNGSSRTDGWNKRTTSDETEIASIDGYKTYISGYSDAVDESKEASKKEIYGSIRYGWFKPAETRISDNYLETYPYTLPVRGAYMTFEPTQNGTLTVYILQNGAWNTFDEATTLGGVSYAQGDIKPGEFRPHSFYICNQRGLNADQFSPKSFKYTTKQKVQGDYYCDLTNNTDDPNNIASWKEFKVYMSDKEKQAVAAKWKSGINDAQEIVQLDNGSFLAIQKGIVKYTFFVTANETYYMFSNFSKLGFCGANFVPSETVIPTDDAAHKITLSDETAYPKLEKVIKDATDPDNIKYAWKFGDDIKGYVPGFTIPLFKSITLNRTFKKGQWTTLTLPFNLTQTEVEQIFGKGTQILVFQDAKTEGTKLHIKFFYHEIQNILPGYPYLIKPTLDGYDNGTTTATDYAPKHTIDASGDHLTSFTVYDKAINPNIEQHEFTAISPGESYVAKGTPGYCTADENGEIKKKYEEGDLFISDTNGKLYISKGSSYGKGYRSYIDGPASSATKTLSLSFSGVEDGEDDGTTTEISVAELADDVIEAFGIKGVYNLNGQKVSETTRNLPAGIYVVNGRKVVVK